MISAGRQARLAAGATQERTLAGIACTPLFGAAQVSDSGPAGPPHCLGFPDPLSQSTPTPCTCGGDPNAVRLLPCRALQGVCSRHGQGAGGRAGKTTGGAVLGNLHWTAPLCAATIRQTSWLAPMFAPHHKRSHRVLESPQDAQSDNCGRGMPAQPLAPPS
jgi:hypothetical protein